jgi:N-acetylmuramoyl-L-alanine amidase
MLSAVTLRRLSLVQLLILLLACAPLAGLAASHEPLFPRLESGVGTLRVGDRSFPLEYSKTAAGVLVALEPFVSHLGGALEVGPMREFHRLELGGMAFLFGPDTLTLTSGEEIIDLSQPPVAGGLGLHVPLDLLQETYGRQLAYEFRWDERSRTLTVLRQQAREISVSLDTVQVQGVTTLVFEFGERPRYRIQRVTGGVEVEMIGDTLRSLTRRPFTPDPLVRGVRMAGPSIAIQLGPRAVAEDYVLDSPFRLVFDVHRAETPPPPPSAAAPPLSRLPRREGEIDTIVIDPGHGGVDTGARGSGGSLEKNLTLILARQLKRRLEARLPVRVVLTRDQDEELPLDSRSSIANQQKASLFVSIHLNSTPRGDAQGAETYFLSLEASDELAAAAASAENSAFEESAGDSEGDPLHDLQLILWDLAQTHHLAESQRLAAIIQEELNLTLSLRNRGVKQAPFRVLMGAAMPAVLVELGFLTDAGEEHRLNDPDYRGQLTDTLVRAIVRYRATMDARDTPAASEALP